MKFHSHALKSFIESVVLLLVQLVEIGLCTCLSAALSEIVCQPDEAEGKLLQIRSGSVSALMHKCNVFVTL